MLSIFVEMVHSHLDIKHYGLNDLCNLQHFHFIYFISLKYDLSLFIFGVGLIHDLSFFINSINLKYIALA